MCTLAVYLQSFHDQPLVVAANRDEFFDRETFGPALVPGDPPVYCGRDGVHGGTWLGVNGDGLVAALLNRRSPEAPDPRRRSRGLLCMDALAHRRARDAIDATEHLNPLDYNPFNLLVADAEEAWVVSALGGEVTRTRLSPGLHLLTNLAVDDPECPRIAASTRKFAEIAASDPLGTTSDALVDRLHPLLASHDLQLDPRDPSLGNSLCLHLETFGTRSSTILLLDRRGDWDYRHCAAPPCRGEYERIPAGISFASQRRRA